MLAYRHRNAGAVIHSHSQNALLATVLWPGKEFRCTHLEMIKVKKKCLLSNKIFLNFKHFTKGIYDHQLERYLRYDEELIVPIIENTPFEKDLEESMWKAMQQYPGSTAVLVRRHGIYVWGATWQKAKAQ